MVQNIQFLLDSVSPCTFLLGCISKVTEYEICPTPTFITNNKAQAKHNTSKNCRTEVFWQENQQECRIVKTTVNATITKNELTTRSISQRPRSIYLN